MSHAPSAPPSSTREYGPPAAAGVHSWFRLPLLVARTARNAGTHFPTFSAFSFPPAPLPPLSSLCVPSAPQLLGSLLSQWQSQPAYARQSADTTAVSALPHPSMVHSLSTVGSLGPTVATATAPYFASAVPAQCAGSVASSAFLSAPPPVSVSVPSWSPTWAAAVDSSRSTPSHGAFSWSVPSSAPSYSLPSSASSAPSLGRLLGSSGDRHRPNAAGSSSRRSSSSSVSLSLSLSIADVPSSSIDSAAARRSSSHSSLTSFASDEPSDQDGGDCPSSQISAADSSDSDSSLSSSSSCSSSSSSDSSACLSDVGVVRRQYAMSAFQSSAHRCPVAELQFHTQRQFTLRSCDLSQWSSADLQAEVAVTVRVMWDGAQHWVVAKDICALIGKRVGSVGRAIYAFNRREKARMIVEQTQEDESAAANRPLVQVMSVLSEQGVRRLLARTRSDRAQEVKEFIHRALAALKQQQRQQQQQTGGSNSNTPSHAATATPEQRDKRSRSKRDNNASDGGRVSRREERKKKSKVSSGDEPQSRAERQGKEDAQQADNILRRQPTTTADERTTQRHVISAINDSDNIQFSTDALMVDVSLPFHSPTNSAFDRVRAAQHTNIATHASNDSDSSGQAAVHRPRPASEGTVSPNRRHAMHFRPIVLHQSTAQK